MRHVTWLDPEPVQVCSMAMCTEAIEMCCSLAACSCTLLCTTSRNNSNSANSAATAWAFQTSKVVKGWS